MKTNILKYLLSITTILTMFSLTSQAFAYDYKIINKTSDRISGVLMSVGESCSGVSGSKANFTVSPDGAATIKIDSTCIMNRLHLNAQRFNIEEAGAGNKAIEIVKVCSNKGSFSGDGCKNTRGKHTYEVRAKSF